jgi:hypothetical protein
MNRYEVQQIGFCEPQFTVNDTKDDPQLWLIATFTHESDAKLFAAIKNVLDENEQA